ncbi:hypothetical protein [Streptomyces soliscabiei]|uniref:hypothetical protein n=1 Tax=Streptomyces soliscabiei TaxID=588897 RepID=UPI0029A7A675|nr:hypothetical protein [Streptomyces sp. NY05-11A]MDX2678275.1 hypothetical protein [Streptomyces sp. NY05-11A]
MKRTVVSDSVGAGRPRLRTWFQRNGEPPRKDAGTYLSVLDAGPSLAEAVDVVGGLPEESVLRIAAGVAGALAGVHESGRGHGDLRPSNVLLTRDGVRLTGFGGHRAVAGGVPALPPGKAVGPHEPSGDMVALGTLLVTAYTGSRGATGPSADSDPDGGVLPVRLRQVVARCLTEEPGARPTPAQLLESIGPLTSTPRPWPPAVNELIARRHSAATELRFGATELTVAPEAGVSSGTRPPEPTDLVPPERTDLVPPAPVEVAPAPAAPRLRLAALVVVVLAGVIAVALVVLTPGRDSGPLTIVTPTPNLPSVQEPPEPTWSEESETPEQSPSAPPQEEVTDLTAPSEEPPTPVETQQTRQPGAIADCAGKPLVEPDELLVACGDGGAMLDNLTWTNWGEETATATGWKWERVCTPSCVNGTQARSPATVSVFGLTGGRYTFMQVSTPQSPVSPYSRYTLDEFGPTLRG